MNIGVNIKKCIPSFGIKENNKPNSKTKPYDNDCFTRTKENSKIEQKDMQDNLQLTTSIKKVLNSDDKTRISSFLDEFSESTTFILRRYKKDDVIAAVQTFIDYASVEEDKSLFGKYISIIHSSICPKTGVGNYVNTDSLSKNPHANEKAKSLIEDIRNDSKKD